VNWYWKPFPGPNKLLSKIPSAPSPPKPGETPEVTVCAAVSAFSHLTMSSILTSTVPSVAPPFSVCQKYGASGKEQKELLQIMKK